LHCLGCGYPHEGGGPRVRCPECGRLWDRAVPLREPRLRRRFRRAAVINVLAPLPAGTIIHLAAVVVDLPFLPPVPAALVVGSLLAAVPAFGMVRLGQALGLRRYRGEPGPVAPGLGIAHAIVLQGGVAIALPAPASRF